MRDFHGASIYQYVIDKSFPRTRGDAPGSCSAWSAQATLPPHTRGCTRRRRKSCICRWASPAHAGMHLKRTFSVGFIPSFPAHAGMHLWHRLKGYKGPGFPRTRGDAPMKGRLQKNESALPPHTRGCTRFRQSDLGRLAASPAHAGMHPPRPCRASSHAGFPRTRGDAPVRRPAPPGDPLLPPHTRGCTPPSQADDD